MQIVFATNNPNKLSEIRQILGSNYQVLSLDDIGCHDDIAETAPTLEGNALIKARYVKEHYGYDCFADDTGLEVLALGGQPGVHTARYAYPNRHDPAANNAKLLSALQSAPTRKAQFRTVIALIYNGSETLFEGTVRGEIATQEQGTLGFGYDPLFIPEPATPINPQSLTFAQLGIEIKNQISHRARAVAKLAHHLAQLAH